jgi:hypothetical protein
MRYVKAKDVKPGMVATGTEKGDWPGPVTVISVEKHDGEYPYRITGTNGKGETDFDNFPANGRIKIVS